jgi:hypothetical protein
MKSNIPLSSRRDSVAGVAALLLSVFSRPADARDDERDDVSPPPCCGNGPPNVYAYGIGQPVTPIGTSTSVIQILNPLFGKKDQKSQYAWVFVPDAHATAIDYFDQSGNHQTPPTPYLNPTGFKGLVWAIAPGFTLVLQWPTNNPTIFSTRPFGSSENQ